MKGASTHVPPPNDAFFFPKNVPRVATDKTPVETAQEAYKLGKKLKRSATFVRDLLDQVCPAPGVALLGREAKVSLNAKLLHRKYLEQPILMNGRLCSCLDF